jgi:hypothetical protein
MRADINDEDAVATAVAGAYGVVNAVSLYLECGTETYHTVHVEAADGSHAKHGVRALSGSYMFRGSEPISPRARSTYAGVELMEVDTVPSLGMPGFDALGIAPQTRSTASALVAATRVRTSINVAS